MKSFLIVLAAVLAPFVSGQDVEGRNRTTEIFHVSRVGRANAAETREQLIDFYREVEVEFNREAKKEFQAKKRAFEGARVRILEVMDAKDGGNSLYLVAYDGGPSVFSIEGEERWKAGDLTDPLEIVRDGVHITEVTRVVVENMGEKPDRHPALEEAEEELATFFGIPIGGGSARESKQDNPSGPAESGVRWKRVVEEKTLPRFRAERSKKQLTEPVKFSTDRFVAAVKNGEIYELDRKEDRRCQECGGFKRVPTTRPLGKRDPDGKMKCPECKGEGTIAWEVTYRVTW